MSLLVFWRLIIDGGDRLKISLSGLIGALIIALTPFLIDFLNYVNSFQITFFHIVVVLLSFLIGKENREKILKAYISVMVFISAISLIYFFINLIFWSSGGIAQFISPLYRSDEISAYVFPLWSVYDVDIWHFPRNMSMFYEPGAFAFHLTICIMLTFKQKRKISLIIFLSAALTTFSTTMYLCLFFIFLYTVFYKGFRLMKPKFLILIFVLIAFIFSRVESGGQNWNYLSMVRITTFEKFNSLSSSYSSTAGRMSYSVAAFEMFYNSYMFGKGHYSSNYLLDFSKMEGGATTTSALFGLLAELGVFGLFCIYLYILFFQSFKLFTIPITMIWLNGEFMQYMIFMLFILAHQADIFFIKILSRKGKLNI